MGKISSKVGLLDSLEASINPATEDSLEKFIGFGIGAYDYVSRGWVAGTFTETWTLKTGGSGGTTVATIVIVYDDVNKSNIVTVTKT